MSEDWPWTDNEPWQAEITRTVCPWVWSVKVTKGLIGFREEPLAFGTRRHVEKVARRRIRREERRDRRLADRTIITGAS